MTLPTLFSLSPPSPLGVEALAQEWPRTSLYAILLIHLLPYGSVLSMDSESGTPVVGGTVLAHRDMVLRIGQSVSWSPWEVPLRHDLLTQVGA